MKVLFVLMQEKQPAVRIVKKQTLEALKEVGYNERETTQVCNILHFLLKIRNVSIAMVRSRRSVDLTKHFPGQA